MSDVWWLLPLALLVATALTEAIRRYALTRQLMDIPNARSSHTRPTPRGGGVAIVLSFLLALGALYLGEAIPVALFIALLGAGGLVALVGFLDDHKHVPARWRLIAHFAAAGWALFWLEGAPELSFFGITVDAGPLGAVMFALYLVWMLNLYNFMDGIDGIAGVEAVTVGIGAALMHAVALSGDHGTASVTFGSLLPVALLPLLLACAVSGFLIWNFPPAKIFMGDAGSGFLGIVLGVLSVDAAHRAPELFWGWLILLGVFVVDATVTLLRRLKRSEKVYEAHRCHAYQHASRRWGGHLPVTVWVGAINLLWLLPIALAVGAGELNGVPGLLLAYIPLTILALKLKAGAPE